ncbi:Anaerobic dimethyl sulfoxide reductase chain B [Coriobacteriaceae bacterium CHKCI002]|nr:Anaerobic dimethyl sulfoxide reductase chain B [Coriobacteriaceae bacterium CHKCI002]
MAVKQVGFYYDQTRCSGCKTCQVACKDKNRLEVGTVLREVRSYQVGAFPSVKMYHFSAACNHCQVPACKDVCPVGAITKDEEDGTVVIDHEACIGCSSCVKACPYGVPRIDEKSGLSYKCDGCIELRKQGYLPACVEACPYRALDFGDVEELKEKHGGDLVTELPAMGEGNTGPNTLIKPRDVAVKELGTPITL